MEHSSEHQRPSHLVFGSGLIGSYIGAILTLNNQLPGVVARGSWLTRLGHPLTLTDYLGQREAVPPLMQDEQAKPAPADIVWLTVKCTAIKNIAAQLRPVLHTSTIIVCCQNGIGAYEMIKTQFPQHTVIRAVVPFNVVSLEPQHLHRGSEGTLALEATGTSSDKLILNALQHHMLSVGLVDDIYAMQWAKLQLNLGNGVNALAGVPVRTMLTQRGYRRVIAQLMDELLAVCRPMRIRLPRVARLPGWALPSVLRLPDCVFRRVAGQMLTIDDEVKTSMWWDLHNGRPTERGFMYGAVIEAGQQYGLRCNANRAINRLLQQAEQRSNRGEPESKLSPSELVSAIAGTK
ncbi:2-dehydropantoate 2-reductase [Alteromonas sp. ASW11-19]|uniref:2-dehydropantoate 2-reductase n=1 Tax=Alteromonas salexigens TaxID=2982530 RepID=A0ABT2VLI5_9ALTE|nr:2-dehydropantoate 2-reductase [Alteromonas salexigens]MCU7553914.1 2-dehydropantoate 2-reductase [Alteromonas salexigens]